MKGEGVETKMRRMNVSRCSILEGKQTVKGGHKKGKKQTNSYIGSALEGRRMKKGWRRKELGKIGGKCVYT